MSKSLTLSMSLALALGFSGVVKAGGHFGGGCATCGLASPQGVTAAPQASAQGYVTETGGCDTCAPAKKKHNFLACLKPKPKMYTYEWVLKKKKVHGHKAEACDTCGTESYVTPSAQGYASPQGATYAAPQATYGSGQASVYPTSDVRAAEPAGDAVPPAPSAPAPSAPAAPAPPAPAATSAGLLFLNGAGN